MTGHFLAGLLLALPPAPAVAQDVPEFRVWEWRALRNQLDDRRLAALVADEPKLPDAAGFDRLVVDTLRDVHNRGADLYNTAKDFQGAYRIYEGALRTVRPLLAHRPGGQRLIDDGLSAAEKESTPAQKAFKLHETIEAVRKYLKEVGAKSDEVPAKPKDEPKKPKDEPKMPPEVAPPPKDKKPEEKKPVEVKKPKDPTPPPAKTAGTSGRVTLKGKPLAAAEVTLVSLDLAKPRVFTATATADGSYAFKEAVPPGKYAVTVAGKGVPEKYTTTASGVVIDVKAGDGTYDFDLK